MHAYCEKDHAQAVCILSINKTYYGFNVCVQIPHTYAVLEPDSPYWEPPNGIGELRKKIFQEYHYPTIPESDIKLQGKLGCGEFGEVYKAEAKYNGTRTSAAVKTLVSKQDNMNKAKLLKEAAIMGQFEHPCVVKLYGLVETSEKVTT